MIAGLLAVTAVALALGQPVSGVDLEREALAIDAMLIAPCCFSQQVSLHQSEAAAEVRRDVRTRLAAGQTRQQILDAYVEQYGKRILAEPPAAGFDMALYVVPIVLFLASAGLVVVIARRFASRAPETISASANSTPITAMSPEENARLDDELRDLD